MSGRPTNWIFLGDSITEGIGSRRSTYVSELANRLRAAASPCAVHDFRLRQVEEEFNRFIRVNVAGYLRRDEAGPPPALWFWNLASEGRTIESDQHWLPLIDTLRPERVFVHRGSLESIVRPACFHDGRWPFWIPGSWRGLVSMDPRCYFSDTPLRKMKQSVIDGAKQRARLRLLAARAPKPLIDADQLLAHYEALLIALRSLPAAVTVLGLLPTDDRTFPGSAAHFLSVNRRLQALAAKHGADFLDWHTRFGKGLFYRDGLHPNPAGSARLAEILHARLIEQGAV